MSERQDPRPRDDTDAVKDLARDLAEVAAQIATFKGEANASLSDPSYDALRVRLENAHAAVEARRRVRLNEGRLGYPGGPGLSRTRSLFLPSLSSPSCPYSRTSGKGRSRKFAGLNT